jgi:cell division transport system permease protein
LLGGALGTAFAVGMVLLVGLQLATLGSDLLGGLQMSGRDWSLLAMLPIAFALLATYAARMAVLGALRRIL